VVAFSFALRPSRAKYASRANVVSDLVDAWTVGADDAFCEGAVALAPETDGGCANLNVRGRKFDDPCKAALPRAAAANGDPLEAALATGAANVRGEMVFFLGGGTGPVTLVTLRTYSPCVLLAPWMRTA
jgi:hypothetical protein